MEITGLKRINRDKISAKRPLPSSHETHMTHFNLKVNNFLESAQCRWVESLPIFSSVKICSRLGSEDLVPFNDGVL